MALGLLGISNDLASRQREIHDAEPALHHHIGAEPEIDRRPRDPRVLSHGTGSGDLRPKIEFLALPDAMIGDGQAMLGLHGCAIECQGALHEAGQRQSRSA